VFLQNISTRFILYFFEKSKSIKKNGEFGLQMRDLTKVLIKFYRKERVRIAGEIIFFKQSVNILALQLYFCGRFK